MSIFSAIAVFVLLIASINYMNLATARSAGRAKEVGIRKVLGSYRAQLMRQFIAESMILAFLAMLISLSFVELILPFFNTIADKDLAVNYAANPQILFLFLLIVLTVGLFSGTYPAFFLSSFNPVVVLKGKFVNNRKAATLRKALVVFQFAISIVMIIGTWIVYQQLNYVNNKHLGFKKDQTLVIEVDRSVREKVPLIKRKLLQNPHIIAVAGASVAPGNDEQNTQGVMIEQGGQMKENLIQTFFIDYDYLDMMGIQLKEGRNYSAQMPSDSNKAVIVNETLIKKMGWKDSGIGKKFLNLSDLDSLSQLKTATHAKVIGVVRDFHLNSLHRPIEPLAMYLSTKNFYKQPGRLFVRFHPQKAKEVLTFIEKTYQEFDQKHPYEPYFLDQNFAKQYESDFKRGQIFLAFSGLTIFIACLGLFGLASFTAEQRTKEIGIRKVLGASVFGIVRLISKDFVVLVLLSNLIAFPLAFWAMNSWLQDFAYRTEVWENWYIFILAALLALSIALITVASQALRAARVNPAKVLKYE